MLAQAAAHPAEPEDDAAFQAAALQAVSRTFALTIPQLPEALDAVVGNAYLLCRIADTIEDDNGLSPQEKKVFSDRFIALLAGIGGPADFAADLASTLTTATTPAEHALVRETPRVLRITRGFTSRQQAQLARCVRIMSRGMAEFQNRADHAGLPDLPAFDRYCYCVAGVVGEMLTAIFCEYSMKIERHRERLMTLAISFGAALQMTNILKDVWNDHRRGACWLPRDVFDAHGIDLHRLDGKQASPGFHAAMREMISIAHGHLRNALDYVLLIPKQETGIRRFCLWALGMAVLTLRKINVNLDFTSNQQVKISRTAVRGAIAFSNRFASNDSALRLLLWMTTRGLPPATAPTAASLAACRDEPVIRSK